MIKEVLRLIKPGAFLPCFEFDDADDESRVVVRPQIISICAADQRYFRGKRPQPVLDKKLPMALIHEALGICLYDPLKLIPKGTPCVLIPIDCTRELKNLNYQPGVRFRSSGCDGFCQELMSIAREEVIPLEEMKELFVFSELVSVCCQALNRAGLDGPGAAEKTPDIAVLGDGSMGFLMALTCRYCLPGCRLQIFGKHEFKLAYFSFADKIASIYDKAALKTSSCDFCFECVGGEGSQDAIATCQQLCRPCGKIVMLGVSEHPISLNSRLVLEKGLTLAGTSRSVRADFLRAVELIKIPGFYNQLSKMVSDCYEVRNYLDLESSFINAINNQFKTLCRINL